MIKVLQVIGSLNIGGAENMIVSWHEGINPKEFQFDYIVFNEENSDYKNRVEKINGRIFNLPSPTRNPFKFYRMLKEIQKQYHYDILHAHTLFSNGIILKMAKYLGFKKRISHSHSGKNKVKENVVTVAYGKWMQALIQKEADVYLACSESAGNFLYGEAFFKQHGTLIENAILAEAFSYKEELAQALKKQYHLEDSIVIGMVARFHEVKNHTFMIEVLKSLVQIHPKYTLVLAGDGPLLHQIQAKVKDNHLEKHVLFLGMVNNVKELLNVFDVVVMPSFHEGFPLALLEAQANGVATMISNTITQEVKLADNLMHLPLEVDAWVSAIVNMQQSKRINHILNTKYDLKTSILKLEEIYRR